MKNLFIQLKALLESNDGIEYVNKWKQQHQMVIEGKMPLFQCPAVFIEFVGTVPTNQMSMGGGVQVYPLRFRLHILSWMLDSGDGDFEKNLEIYDLEKSVYKTVNKFQPGLADEATPVGSCIRTGFNEDYEWSHNGVTHLIQDWETTNVDTVTEEPVDGVDGPAPPLPLQLDIITEEKQTAGIPYDANIQYLAINESYVRYQDVIYVIKSDTPNPAGAFDLQYWTKIEPTSYNYTPS